MTLRDGFKDVKRMVIKVGTSTLTYPSGQLNLQRIENLVREIADLHNRGMEVVLVTSGAIGTGASRMGLKTVPKTLPEKQALAAIGQGALMHLYEKLFGEYNKIVAQVLLTREDLDERMRYLNATNTLITIMNMGAIPVINENDTVTVEEIRFGDNDTLSAMVAGIVDADLLIILSDVDGLFDRDPRLHEDAHLISAVYEITPEMESNSTSRGIAFSSGGMFTKLRAARMSMTSGVAMVIANSDENNIIRRIVDGEKVGTLFVPREDKLQARKKWIAYGTVLHGHLIVDSGCEVALLEKGKSLLPSGIKDIQGDFERGTVVAVKNQAGVEIARGIVNYDSGEIAQIKGKQSSEIEELLGNKDYDEVIHRNNLWIKNS